MNSDMLNLCRHWSSNNHEFKRAVNNWENYKTENIGINNPDLSIFQKYVEKGLKNNKLIYEDKLIQCFFPGPQHSPPYVWSDNIKKVDNIKTVRHSKVHFLVIPKKRIFNIISMKKKHIPLLKYMNKIGIMIAKIILRANNFTQCSRNKFRDDWCSFPPMNKEGLVKTYNLLTNHIKCYDGYHVVDPKLVPYIPSGQNLQSTISEEYFDSHINGYFHLYPLNSVDWLHLHIQVDNLRTYKGIVESYKNIHIDEIIKHLNTKNKNTKNIRPPIENINNCKKTQKYNTYKEKIKLVFKCRV